MAVSITNQVSPTTTLLFFLFLFLLGVGDSSSFYQPIDNIPLVCGSHGNLSNSYLDGRIWVGDIDSKFFPSDHQQNGASMTSKADAQSTSVTTVPYMTARLSRSQFTYSFPVSPGHKFIRLYFYSANYISFDRSKALFSVRAGRFTLLRDFNTSNPQTNLVSLAIQISPLIYVVTSHWRRLKLLPKISTTFSSLASVDLVTYTKVMSTMEPPKWQLNG